MRLNVAASTILYVRNIADAVLRRSVATYIDLDRFLLFLIRVAPGPNSALNVAAPGLKTG